MNTTLKYPLLLLLSTERRSFEAMSNITNETGKEISECLARAEETFTEMNRAIKRLLRKNKKLWIVIDETLIKKIYSKCIEGTEDIYDLEVEKKIRSYKMLTAGITNGNHFAPFACMFVPGKAQSDEEKEEKNKIIINIITSAKDLFPEKLFTVLADGAFATKKLLGWGNENNISMEMRMHKNRRVLYNEDSIVIKEMKEFQLTGKQMSRTVKVVWHELNLFVTAQRRIDKNNKETIVFQVSNYQAKPSEHVASYKKRWTIEKFFRTAKQKLGLQECFSTKLKTQYNHVVAVLFTYILLQLERQKRKLSTPEEALRALKLNSYNALERLFSAPDRIFGDIVY